ncbi:allantoinase AllB [Rhodoplanes sp. TEM]|uniref:Allantoinase AllB n=1 Tax=Rhodoplanes tepidamans TaxID=200616 RepID=A0ABT5J4Y8_RHOTP|nr:MULTISPECIES: allantoinase AllB [Rhodoplanes]MDC7784130.1 allantoinase AllB [Rhodoplanes tepidamans]MDC7983225.1 allantoinase AllB [Rhodoplanes sp. TEM]MDQ0356772.1 dihydroorotase [Rhodoplanes tepidamans]
MTADLVIHGGTVVTDTTTFAASVAIKDGRVLAVGAREAMPEAAEQLDATGLHVLPGAIDVHVHFREPGYTHKEDFGTGTAAAAFGGVTTVFDMPNVIPATGTAEALAAKHRLASEKAYVDYGLYGLLGEDTIAHVPDLVAGGVIGFKLYMGNTFGNIPSPTTGGMLEAFEVVAPTGKRVSLHAETASIMARREARLRAAGRKDPLAHLAARPAVVAVEAVARAAILSEWTGCRIHVLHISSAEELRPLAEAKARGVDITGETCPQYLLLGAEDYGRIGPVIRVNPPVREARNQAPLWAALASGVVDMIATDHAPHIPDEKVRDDIFTVDCGFPGVETQMPLMLTEVAAGRMSISDYVRWSAVNPAKCWGLYPRKGHLQPGADADIAIVDLARRWTIDDAKLQSRAKITPWHGRGVTGLPVHTLVRGRFVMKDRALVESARGTGRSVHTIQEMPAPRVANPDSTMTEIVRIPAASRGDAATGAAA